MAHAGERRRFALGCCLLLFAVVGASAQGEDEVSRNKEALDAAIPYRLDLMSMMEGMGAMTGSGGPRIIDVGLHWKYQSATAEDKMTTPKIRVGTSEATTSLVHVETKAAKKAAIFTGADDVEIEVASRNKVPSIKMASGAGKWDISVPDGDSMHLGKASMKATIKMADGKVGIATDTAPKTSLHVQSNAKGDHLYFQGNFDGKTDALMDSMITMEASADYRGRGMFMPHRGDGAAGAKTSWFAGVPVGGGGYQVGSAASHMVESASGPYQKKMAHMFITNDGKVGFGHNAPQGQVDIQLLPDNEADADRALNIRAGSVNVDMGQGVNTQRIPALVGEKEFVQVGSSKKTQEREIRLQADEKNYVTVSRYNAFVGIGGITTPEVPLHVKGNMKIVEGQFSLSMEPKAQEQTMVLNSKSTTPAAIGFRQADKPYMTVSAGKAGGTIEMANGAALTVANGKLGVGTDPTELFHVKGGNVLLDGKSVLMFGSKVGKTSIYSEADGLYMTGGLGGKLRVESSDVELRNAGSNAKMDIIAEPTKEAVVQMTSGSNVWRQHATQAGTGSLFFSNKQVRVAMTTDGKLGVGIDKPAEALHVVGSTFMESADAEVFATMKAKSESMASGVAIQSGVETWKVMTTASGTTDNTPGSLEFAHAAKTHMVITKTGTLGVGIGTPQAGTSLHVKGPSMFAVGAGKGKIVISTPDTQPGMSFFDNEGFRRMDVYAHSKGMSMMSVVGHLGVGIAETKAKLHIYDSKSTKLALSRSGKKDSQGYLQYNSAYLRLGTNVADGVQIDVNSEAKMTFHPNGNIGIATATPQSQLQIGKHSHVYEAGAFTVMSGNAFFDGAKYKYTEAGAAGAVMISKDGVLSFHTGQAGSANMEITDLEEPKMSITQKGFIGVGTKTPDTSMHLASPTEATLGAHGAMMIGEGKGKPNMVFDAKSVVARDNGQPAELRLQPFGGKVTIFADSTKSGHVATFTAEGNVGFGPAEPVTKLQVSEGAGRYATIGIGESPAGIAVLRYKESMMTLGFSKGTNGQGGSNKEDAITILKDGKVGIGMSAPKSRLSVQGDVSVMGKLTVGGKEIVTEMNALMEENKRLSMELSATKEMLMSMSSNMKRMSEMQMTKESKA